VEGSDGRPARCGATIALVAAPSPLHARLDEGVARLTLSRPQRHNALSVALLDALAQALDDVVERGARAVVLAGAGRSFSSGADLDEVAALAPGQRRAYLERTLATLRRLDDLAVPTIAAVHGHALAGGCELALVCDVVVAGADAVFALPETALGMLPVVALVRGRARLARGDLARMVLAGERLDATQARAAGLAAVVTVAGDHERVAGALAARIAAAPPAATRAALRLLREPASFAAALDAAAALGEA